MAKENLQHPEYQYLDLLRELVETGSENIDRGTDAKSFSLFGRQIRFDLSRGLPLLTTKKVFWKGVVEELYWFTSGQTNVKYLIDNGVHIWDDYPYKIYQEKAQQSQLPTMTKEAFVEKMETDDTFAKEHGKLPRIYGELWRDWPTRTDRTIDQLAWIIQELRKDPFARNAIVNSWHPEYLYSMASSKESSRFPICHNMFQVSIKDGKLYLQLYQRSADIFLGVPFNIGSYALLNILLAHILGVKPGEFIHSFGDVHVYENHIDQAKEQLKRTPRPFPTVKVDPSIKEIDDFKPELITLEGYDPHPAIKGELTVAGGFREKDHSELAKKG